MLRIALLTALSALAVSAQATNAPWNVRHTRWGMTPEEVLAAEANSNPKKWPHGSAGVEVVESDTIAGFDADIFFHFKENQLSGVVMLLGDTEDKHFEDALYRWFETLERKYGEGVLFINNEKLSNKTATLSLLQATFHRFLSHGPDFKVQFSTYEQTVVSLSCETYEKGGRLLAIDFTPRASANF